MPASTRELALAAAAGAGAAALAGLCALYYRSYKKRPAWELALHPGLQNLGVENGF